MPWARHFLSAEAQACGRSAEIAPESARTAAEEPAAKATQERPRRNRYGVRTDNRPIALRAFWSMHVEAKNWSGMGHAEHAARSVFRRMRCAFGAVASQNPTTKWTGDRGFIRVPGPTIKQSCSPRTAQIPIDIASGGRTVKPAPLQRLAQVGDGAGDGETRRQRGTGSPPAWSSAGGATSA
jgi:hypothetical protein